MSRAIRNSGSPFGRSRDGRHEAHCGAAKVLIEFAPGSWGLLGPVQHRSEAVKLSSKLTGLAVAGLIASGVGSAEAKSLFVYVSPNPIGVDDFLKLGKTGTERIAKALGADAKTYESADPTTQRQNLEAAAKAGAAVVIAIGFEFNDMLPDVATAYPNVKFLQIDSCPFGKMKPNIYCSVFREYEASFLTGAEAALTTKTGKVGAISALDIPFLHRYTDGFIEGAKHVKPDIKISPTLWVGGNSPFQDPARGQERAAAMLADGADRILAAGAGSNGGIFKAVQDAPGADAFGVDVNQCPQAAGFVMDNVEKKTDVAVELAVKGIVAGSQPPISALGLKEGGMTLTGFGDDVKDSKCSIADYPDAIAKVKALRDEIVAGSLTIADPMAAK
jgi:basic membrane protein A and related proteins